MFLIFKFHFWIFENTSEFWAVSYKIESNLLLVRITVCTCLPIGWRTFFWQKIRQNVALFWFGLRDAGILYSHAVIQNPIVYIPAFLETGLAEKIAVCDAYNPLSQQVGGLYVFLYEAA